MANRKSNIGDVINGFKLINEVGKDQHGAILYECRCEKCGHAYIRTRGNMMNRKGNRCKYCKTDYGFRYEGETAIGKLSDGTLFQIDKCMVPKFKQYDWHINSKGYIMRGNRNLPKMLLHWYVLGYDAQHSEVIDHINRDKTDCRICNLRVVSNQQNSMNRSIQKNNTSGFVGVCFVKRKNLYMASIGLGYKKLHLGYSSDAVLCAQMYNTAAEILFGDFAGHKNDVPRPCKEISDFINQKCKPYLAESINAQRPICTPISA